VRGGEEARPLYELFRVVAGILLACAPALLIGTVALAVLAGRTRVFRWDAFLVALVLLGPAMASAWVVLALLLFLPVARSLLPTISTLPAASELVSIVRQRAPPALALLMAAAGLEVSMRSFPASPVAALALIAAIGLAARLDEAGAIVLAAVLVGKGLDPGIAVALLAFGPLTRAAMVRALGKPWRAAATLILDCAVALAGGKALSASGALSAAQHVVSNALRNVHAGIAEQTAASPLGAAAAVILLALALATLWSEGVRGWFAPLRHGPRTV